MVEHMFWVRRWNPINNSQLPFVASLLLPLHSLLARLASGGPSERQSELVRPLLYRVVVQSNLPQSK